MNIQKTRIHLALLVSGVSSVQCGCAALVPSGETQATGLVRALEARNAVGFDATRWIEVIRRIEPTAREDLLESILLESRADLVSAIFDGLHAIAVQEKDLILLGDLEFCKNNDVSYLIFTENLAKCKNVMVSRAPGFSLRNLSVVSQARERALGYYLAAGDFLGASFVESEISYHTDTDEQACSHIKRALEYLEKGLKNPKRAMPGSKLLNLLRGSYEGELRTRLKETLAKQKAEGRKKGP